MEETKMPNQLVNAKYAQHRYSFHLIALFLFLLSVIILACSGGGSSSDSGTLKDYTFPNVTNQECMDLDKQHECTGFVAWGPFPPGQERTYRTNCNLSKCRK
jgi:hypothetical protein